MWKKELHIYIVFFLIFIINFSSYGQFGMGGGGIAANQTYQEPSTGGNT